MKYGTEPSNWQDKRIQRRKLKAMWKNLDCHYDYDVKTERVVALFVILWAIGMCAFVYFVH